MRRFLGSELGSGCCVNYDARSHRCAYGDGFDVLAFGSCRLRLNERAETCFEILKKLLVGEAHLANREVNDTGFVCSVLNTGCTLNFFNCSSDVVRDGAVSLVGSSWSEHSADFADLGCHIFRCEKDVEISETTLNLSNELVSANCVGSSSFGLSSKVTLRKDRNLSDLTGAVRKVGDTTNVLVALSWVDTEVDRKVNALNELSVGSLLHECESSYDVVCNVLIDGLCNGGVAGRMGILSNVCSQCISPVVQADDVVLPRIWKGEYTAGSKEPAVRFESTRYETGSRVALR